MRTAADTLRTIIFLRRRRRLAGKVSMSLIFSVKHKISVKILRLTVLTQLGFVCQSVSLQVLRPVRKLQVRLNCYKGVILFKQHT